MKIYLCARYGRRDELKGYAAEATSSGLSVVSRWLYAPDDDGSQDPAECHRWATRDRDEVWEADALVAFSEAAPGAPGAGRGNRHVEFGIALAFRKLLVIVGPPEIMFHALAHKRFDTWAEALEHLRPKHEYESPAFFQEIEANWTPLGEVDP